MIEHECATHTIPVSQLYHLKFVIPHIFSFASMNNHNSDNINTAKYIYSYFNDPESYFGEWNWNLFLSLWMNKLM